VTKPDQLGEFDHVSVMVDADVTVGAEAIELPTAANPGEAANAATAAVTRKMPAAPLRARLLDVTLPSEP
jgi:disulfide oxidoreductase YuzD